MSTIKATLHNGSFVPDEKLNWPEGQRVSVTPEDDPPMTGMSETEQGDDAESIKRWIAAFDAIPPLEMSVEEEARWQAAKKAQKEFEKSTFNERADKLQGMFE